MSDWLQQMESERRQWDEAHAWWLALDHDPKYLEWLKAETARVVASLNGQLELLPTEGTETWTLTL